MATQMYRSSFAYVVSKIARIRIIEVIFAGNDARGLSPRPTFHFPD